MIGVSEHVAGRAFDSIAEGYDAMFTNSAIGRAQRAVVWERAASLFPAGSRVLELNCGTGEDALFLASRGVSVVACDASARMLEQASSRCMAERAQSSVAFHLLPSERLCDLPLVERFDGALSNFSGLNCVSDLTEVASRLSERLRPGAPALLCLSTRFCLWEIVHYLAHGDVRRAFRRCNGFHRAKLGVEVISVYYPTLRSMLKSFEPYFRLESVVGIGILVPPSYMEDWAAAHPVFLRLCQWVDLMIHEWRGIRVIGDHMLLHMERI